MSPGLVETVRLRRQLPPPAMRKAIRLAANASAQAFADEIGVTRQAVLHWEKGTRFPRGEHLEKYAQLLLDLQQISA